MKKATLLSILLFATTAFAQDGGAMDKSWYAIAAGLAIGIAAFGGALGQGRIGGSAMDGIARNPQARKDMFVPMIIGLALIESLVIYALVIGFQLAGFATAN